MCVYTQRLQTITGFQRLREVRVLEISGSTQLVHIDGFGGIFSLLSVSINLTPSLCYILNQTPDETYWAVCVCVCVLCANMGYMHVILQAWN